MLRLADVTASRGGPGRCCWTSNCSALFIFLKASVVTPVFFFLFWRALFYKGVQAVHLTGVPASPNNGPGRKAGKKGIHRVESLQSSGEYFVISLHLTSSLPPAPTW